MLKQALWGGRSLEAKLGKSLGSGENFAESWEIVDLDSQQSVVTHGPHCGATLGQLVKEHGPALLGRHDPLPQFPLMFKFLDARQNLSIQVHADPSTTESGNAAGLAKTEAWVILAAEPGSQLWAGLKRGFDRDALAREIARGTAELCLHKIEPRPGDCFFLPAGSVHALGAGLLVAEIQQTSDKTLRLYDWNRVGLTGSPRTLQVEEALDAINYELGPIHPQTPVPTGDTHVERLVDCDQFVLDRWRFTDRRQIPADDRCHLLALLSGELSLAGDPSPEPLRRGDTVLIPAACGGAEIVPHGAIELLDMYLP